MKKQVIFIALIILFSQISNVFSQNNKFEFKIGLGISHEIRPAIFRDYWTPGIFIGGNFGYNISLKASEVILFFFQENILFMLQCRSEWYFIIWDDPCHEI